MIVSHGNRLVGESPVVQDPFPLGQVVCIDRLECIVNVDHNYILMSRQRNKELGQPCVLINYPGRCFR